MSHSFATAIAIIGGGFSGAMVAVHLLRNARHPLTIHLIESRPTLGCGVAYSTAFNCHLMNVPAGKISAFADQPNHFLEWAQQMSSIAHPLKDLPDARSSPVTAHSFVPRKLYGQYVQSVVAEAEATAPAWVRLERVVDEAIAIHSHQDSALIALQSGKTVQVDRVVLALGNFPPRDVTVADSSFYQSDRYIRSGWSSAHSYSLLPDEPVMLIGSGLTAVDWAIALHHQGHRGMIHIVSRRGLLPQAHRLPHSPIGRVPTPALTLDPQIATARLGSRYVRQAVSAAIAQGGDWQSVIDGLRPLTQSIWQTLSLVEKRRFLRHLRPYWEVHRHRVAPAIAHVLQGLQRTGQLQLHAGRIQTYVEDANGVDVVIRRRDRQSLETLRAALVVNCTGSGANYQQIAHPLVQQLLETGLVQPDALAIGLETDLEGALVDRYTIPSDWLYTLGSPRRGQLWETTAIPEIREQAQRLARILLSAQRSSAGAPLLTTARWG